MFNESKVQWNILFGNYCTSHLYHVTSHLYHVAHTHHTNIMWHTSQYHVTHRTNIMWHITTISCDTHHNNIISPISCQYAHTHTHTVTHTCTHNRTHIHTHAHHTHAPHTRTVTTCTDSRVHLQYVLNLTSKRKTVVFKSVWGTKKWAAPPDLFRRTR